MASYARILVLGAWLAPPASHAQPAPTPAPSPWTYHHGPTFEVNLGFGRLHQPYEYGEGLHPAFGGPDFSLGIWLSRRLALTWRLAGAVSSYQKGTTVNVVVGPSLQLWLTDSLWAGGTAGRAFVRGTEAEARDGWGFEVRAGATLNQGSASTFSLSLDFTRGFYSHEDSFGMTNFRYTGLALLAGYQYL